MSNRADTSPLERSKGQWDTQPETQAPPSLCSWCTPASRPSPRGGGHRRSLWLGTLPEAPARGAAPVGPQALSAWSWGWDLWELTWPQGRCLLGPLLQPRAGPPVLQALGLASTHSVWTVAPIHQGAPRTGPSLAKRRLQLCLWPADQLTTGIPRN